MSSHSRIDWKAVRERLAQGEQALVEALEPGPDQIRRVLERRAAALQARSLKSSSETRSSLLLLSVGAERFAADLLIFAEVVRLPGVTIIAGAPPEARGVVNVRGELHCVIDLLRLLRGTSSASDSPRPWGVVFRHSQFSVVLELSELPRVVYVPQQEVNNAREQGGTLRIAGEIAQLLDAPSILQRLESPRDSFTFPSFL